MSRIRFSTLLRDFGPLQQAKGLTEAAWKRAVAEGRFMTVYHGESDWCTPVVGVVRHHGCVSTLCKVVFTRPVPAAVTEVIGMRECETAWQLCDPNESRFPRFRAKAAKGRP